MKVRITAICALVVFSLGIRSQLAAQACYGYPDDAQSGFIAVGAGGSQQVEGHLAAGMEVRPGFSAVSRLRFPQALEIAAVASSLPFCPSVSIGREFRTRDGVILANEGGNEGNRFLAATLVSGGIGIGIARESGSLFFRPGVVWIERYGRATWEDGVAWDVYTNNVHSTLDIVSTTQIGKYTLRAEAGKLLQYAPAYLSFMVVRKL
jgi:hypothetical protein